MQVYRKSLLSLLRIHRLVETCIQVGAFVMATLVAFFLRFDFSLPPIFITHLLFAICSFTGAKLVVFVALGLHRSWWRYVSSDDLLLLAAGNASGSLLGAGVIWCFGPSGFPRSIYVLDFILCFGLTALIRLGARLTIDVLSMRVNRVGHKRALIYGAGDAGVLLAREMRQNAAVSYTLAGFIDDDTKKKGVRLQGVRVLGGGNDLAQIVEASVAEMIFIAIPSASGEQITRILNRCSGLKVKYKTIPPIGEMIESNALLTQIRDVAVEDLLGRQPVRLDVESIRRKLAGQVVLVTGAAGSIGSELCRQIARFEPAVLVGYDIAETALFFLEREMLAKLPKVPFKAEIGSVQNDRRLAEVFTRYRPALVFHAAAYKHVPMMESHVFEAIENNVFGTLAVARCAAEFGVRDFVLISTDKAVRPTNIMGATKRVAELVIRSMQEYGNKFVSVRFGNVLGSNGSVIPIFKEQIAAGGPVTVTHPDMTRYFMTIPEATQLVLQASTLGVGGEIFILDMGDPVKISHLARNLILLSGLRPGDDIRIEYTGMRPGEKLFEELHLYDENIVGTGHEKIKAFAGHNLTFLEVERLIDTLREICQDRDLGRLVLAIKNIVPDYSPSQQLLEQIVAGPSGNGLNRLNRFLTRDKALTAVVHDRV